MLTLLVLKVNKRACSFADRLTTLVNVFSFSSLSVPAAGNLTVRAEVGGDRQSVAESPGGAGGSVCPSTAAAAALHSPWKHGTRKNFQMKQMFMSEKGVCRSSVYFSFSPGRWKVFCHCIRPASQCCPSCVAGWCFSDSAKSIQSWALSTVYY